MTTLDWLQAHLASDNDGVTGYVPVETVVSYIDAHGGVA